MKNRYLIPLVIIVLLLLGYSFLGHDKPRIETPYVRPTPDEPKEYVPEPCLDENLEVIQCKG